MSGYQYNGKLKGEADPWQHRAKPGPKPRYRPQPTQPCGTKAAYNRHSRRKEEACEPCKEAKRVADRKPCGTEAAYQRHRRNHEVPCEACYEAHAEYNRERTKVCGTYKGAMRHTRAGEQLCEPCRLARNEYRMEQHRKKTEI